MDTKIKSALISLVAVFSLVVVTIVLVAQNNRKNKFHSAGSAIPVQSSKPSSQPSNPITRADSVVAFAKTLLGTPYVYGTCTPDGFDCSGFVYYVFKKFNIDVSRSSYTIANQGVEIDSSDSQKGDIILFQGTDLSDPKIGHVGIIITEKGAPIEFIHASSSTKHNGVVITALNSGHYQKRFVKIIRVL